MISVLIVDDDMATVEVIRQSIPWEKLGIDRIETAFNVAGAKKILQETDVDIVISDIEMPQESGLDLLKWIRGQKMECEFLLLTCHENFTYAANAISYEAAAYLTKPFDIHLMEMTLQKIKGKLVNKRSLKKASEYGLWMERNKRVIKLNFWKSLLEGEYTEKRHLEKEIKARHLEILTEKKYCFVYTKLSNIEADMERFGKGILEFILEGFHSEILTGEVENDSVIKLYSSNNISYMTMCTAERRSELKEKCNQLIEHCNTYFKMTVTCCISNAYELMELTKARSKVEQLFQYNVNYYGKTFMESDAEIPMDNKVQIIDLDKLIYLVERKDKTQILRYLKSIFDELTVYKNLNVHSLYLMKQEIIQVVYADLMKQGIQATKLFYDDLSIQMEEKASESIVDMVRWVNYLLGKTFDYEEEVAKSAGIIEKINDYIHHNYADNIGRSQIAATFFLTPEYLAKLYKRKTGVNLKDYINEYRIQKAKEFLKSGQKNVSDVAEAVGFENFSYFSTMFKKLTGVSPKDFRNL